MNERPIAVWIITNKEGTVLSAHCLGCKAGLAETCSHIVSILFRIEDATRINETLVCTQVKCMWLLPTYVSEVPYVRVKVLRSCYIDQCKVRSAMFNTHRGYRSSVLFGYWYELLYKETVQSFQKLGGLQQEGFGFYFQCSRQIHGWKICGDQKGETFLTSEWAINCSLDYY